MNQVRKQQWTTTVLAIGVVLLTAALVVYPKQGFDAGIEGLRVFWDIVFPSLLPFFILSELMLGIGVVRGLGVILEPLMRPVFSVPGIGAFALSMGLAAGYPMDAVITARFREQGLCTRVEGERLLAFTNTADPLFMFGAVAVGMFKSPEVGVLLAIAHYVSSFLVGIGFKWWGRRSDTPPSTAAGPAGDAPTRGNILGRAFREMLKARTEDGRTLGKLLYHAVTESVQTLLMICGFIVFFSVLIEVLHLSGLIRVIGWPVLLVYHLFGIHAGLVNPTLAGLLEIDIGTAQTAAVTGASLLQKVALASGIIAWSGLSVHAQVASVLTQTDIRMRPYFLARFLHAVLAAGLTLILFRLGIGVPAAHTMAWTVPMFSTLTEATLGMSWWHVAWTAVSTWATLLGALLLVSLLLSGIHRVRGIFWRVRPTRT